MELRESSVLGSANPSSKPPELGGDWRREDVVGEYSQKDRRLGKRDVP